MKLKDLLAYENIVIQCHDNPDADALASGFAVYRYLTGEGKNPAFVYGGTRYIRKSNLVMLMKDLKIPIVHVDSLEEPELLVMVDCQYLGGNVTPFPAKQVAVIDHHRISTKLPKLSEVRSNLGACSTLLWQMLKEEGYDVDNDRKLATALYYGLYTDTNGFTEIVHPLDKDLRDEAKFEPALMTKYRNANLSLEELEVAGAALLHSDYIDAYRAAVVKSAPCDPNILGIISDLVLEVDAVDICIVFNILQDGVKLSVRSCTKEIKANELAEELCKGIGSGGGHLLKAGGFIQMDLLIQEYLRFCERQNYTPRMELAAKGEFEQPTASGIKALIEQRLRDYMDNTEIIYADEGMLDNHNLESYRRRPIPWGYVRARELFALGTTVRIRTIHGDSEMVVKEDTIITLGPKGEAYWEQESEFVQHYRYYPNWKYHLREAEYRPTVHERSTGRIVSPVGHARVCVPKGCHPVVAKRLECKVKLFQNRDDDTYRLGHAGDYLVSTTGEMRDAFIVEKARFERMYSSVREDETRKKAVIFDLDGTLLNTLEDLKNATNAALASRGLPECTLEQVRHYVGNGVRNLMIRAVPDGENNPEFEAAFAFFKEYYGAHCLDATAPYRNIPELLQELKAREIPMGIVSNKLDTAVKELTERFFPEVSVAIGEQEGIARKPAPDMVNQALQELQVTWEQAIYVGDSEVDVWTAANSKLPCVSVTWGFRNRDVLKKQGATTLIERPLELLYLL